MPSATYSHAASTRRTVDEVWLRLQEVETWSNIGPVEEVWDATHDDDGLLTGYRWSASVGPTRYRGKAEVVEVRVGELMQLDLDGGEIDGTLTTTISQNGDGSQVEVTLRIVSRGALSSMFFPIVSEVVGRGLPEQVNRFVATLDAAG